MRKPLRLVAPAIGGLAVGVLAVVRARSRWFPVRVEGTSMLPTLQPGDFLAVRAPRRGEPRAGQLVVIRHGHIETVKRVISPPRERALGQDDVWVEGDNAAASTDSRVTGPVKRDAIVGVVRARYKPLRTARTF
jgi:nickel-type superoxide dismutase maturation protease